MKRFLKVVGLFLVLSLFIMGLSGCEGCNPPGGPGGNTGKIAGIVKDSSNNPISNVTVSVYGTTFQATTNSNGQYQILDLPPGTVKVIAYKEGYTTQDKTVTVVAGQTTQADFQLPLFLSDLTGEILFSSKRSGDSERQIYVMNADGTGLTRITNDSYINEGPHSSPDKTKIAFTKNLDIWMMDADGSNQIQLTTSSYRSIQPSFSPDGNYIVFSQWNSATYGDICRIDLTIPTHPITYLTNTAYNDEANPCFSPDGSKIVFDASYNNDREIYIMNADGTNIQQLTNTAYGNYDPCFSPDGKKIVFASSRDGNWEVYVIDVYGHNQTNITNYSDQDLDPNWR